MDYFPEFMSRDAPPTGDVPNLGPRVIAVSLSLTILALILVLLRLWCRWRSRQLGWDDWCAVISVLFSIGHSVNDVLAVLRFGYGKHEVDLPADIRNNGGANLGFWISQLFTKPSLCAIRMSFCFLYLRIFRGLSGKRIMLIKVIMAIVLAYYTAATVATVLTCVPIKRNWNKKVTGKCINNLVFIYVNAGANILIDLIVVGLPIPVIWNMQRNRKVIACGTILLAIPSILVSILRLPTLAPAARGQKPGGDTSWAVIQSTIWTVAELNVPIMACCLVVLAKPIIDLLSPILRQIPYLASRFATKAYGTSGEYDPNSKYGNGRSKDMSRHNEPQRWTKTGDETLVTIGGGGRSGRKGLGSRGLVGLTSDGASDESILGHIRGERDFASEGGAPVRHSLSIDKDGYELQDYKQGIMRTVAVDVQISDR